MVADRFSVRRFVSVAFFAVLGALPLSAGEFHIAFDEGQGATVAAEGDPKLEGSVVGKPNWVDGKAGKALEFNDYGNELVKPKASEATYVRFDHHDALTPSKTVAITAQLWLERRPYYYGAIVEKGTGFGAAYRLVVLRNGKIRASVGNRLLSVESPEPLSLKEWHEVKMQFDGKRLALSIDSKEVAATEGAVEKFASDAPMSIGTRLTGKVDDLVIAID